MDGERENVLSLGFPAPRATVTTLPIAHDHFPNRLLRRRSCPSYNTPPCEAPMPFTLHSHRRFPVYCSVRYDTAENTLKQSVQRNSTGSALIY